MKTIAAAFCFVLASQAIAAVPGAVPESSATADNRYAATIVPAERFETGNLLVERHGDHGVPLILIPGLASGAWVWQDLVRRFQGEHAVYVVTLPGFDGRRAAAGPVLAPAREALRQLIAQRHIERPVLIGHSLGGTLAIAVAETDAALRGVVAIDGLPVMPGSEQTPPAMRAGMAAAIKARMGGADASAFALQQQQYMRGIGVLDMAMADQLARLSARSDPAATVNIMAEAVEQDLRPGLARIGVPLLLVAPYFDADASQRGLTEPMVKDYYASLMAGTPRLTVRTISPSRHFVMFDLPERLAELLNDFLKPL